MDWSESDIIDDLIVTQEGKQIKLCAYREPARGSVPRKGVIFFVHGYGKSLRFLAVTARNLANAGYDIFGMDYRGIGRSTGIRGFIDS